MSGFARLRRINVRTTRQAPRTKSCRLEHLEDRNLLSLLGQPLFPADNPWNQRIDTAPVAANSGAIMSSIISKYGDGRLHPDFGQDYRDSSPLYGIPYNVVHGNSVAEGSRGDRRLPRRERPAGRPHPRERGDRRATCRTARPWASTTAATRT